MKDATEKERNQFTIELGGEALRWKELDEDIHISSFYETKEPQEANEIAQMFHGLQWLNVSEVARTLGIHKSLLSKYISRASEVVRGFPRRWQ